LLILNDLQTTTSDLKVIGDNLPPLQHVVILRYCVVSDTPLRAENNA
jgi:hypothetical protein